MPRIRPEPRYFSNGGLARRRGDGAFESVKLLAVGGMLRPTALEGHVFAGAQLRHLPHHRLGGAPHRDPQHRIAVFIVAEGGVLHHRR